jgi:hypothetical protein
MTVETIGYFEEYFVNQKFVGTKMTEPQDREIGYYGKQVNVANDDIILDNKKRVKKGQEYYTRYYPLNGRQS